MMTIHGPCLAVRRNGPRRPALAAVVGAALIAAPARAEEPLYLRIRVQPEPGSAEAARAAREAVWARSQTRARAVIASVCTGCLAPWRPAPPPEATAAAAHRVAALADPPIPVTAGLEPDPLPEASDPSPEPPIRERRP